MFTALLWIMSLWVGIGVLLVIAIDHMLKDPGEMGTAVREKLGPGYLSMLELSGGLFPICGLLLITWPVDLAQAILEAIAEHQDQNVR